MLIKVMYHDSRHDLVKGFLLDELIALSKIQKFYRYSEDRWIILERDPVRGTGGIYFGPERRATLSAEVGYIEL